MRNWLTGGGMVLLSALLLGVMAGAGSYTANHAQALSYLSNDPKACVNCHIMRESTTAGRRPATTMWRCAWIAMYPTTLWANT